MRTELIVPSPPKEEFSVKKLLHRLTALTLVLALLSAFLPAFPACAAETAPSGSDVSSVSDQEPSDQKPSDPELEKKPVPLNAPQKLAVSVKQETATLTWAKVSGAKGYQIWRKTGKQDYSLLKTVKTPNYKDDSVKNKQTYTYQVSAYYTSEGKTVPGKRSNAVTAEVLPLSGFVICVDAGHGNKKALGKVKLAPKSSKKVCGGTVGTQGSYTGVSEAALTLQVAKKLKTALEEQGATVVMTRTGSSCKLNNIQRCKIATKAGADLTIRLHADSSTSHSAHGISMQLPASTYCSGSIVKKSGSAGKKIYKSVLKTTKAKGRGMVKRRDLVGFNWSKTPTVLIEMGFMSNKREDKKLQTSAYQKKIVKGIVNGTVSYFS